MLTDGVSGEEVPDCISDGCQPLQALYIDEKAADTTANVLLTPENTGHIGEALINYLNPKGQENTLFFLFNP